MLKAEESFHKLTLDEKSSYLCTFITPFRRFRFKKVPYGILTATDEFQRVMDDIFGDLEGVFPYVDDIVVWASTAEEHKKRVEKVLSRCLNYAKCQFEKSSVKYLGHIVSREGLRIDPDRVKDIEAVQTPSDKKGLQIFLCMVNFVGPFIENLSGNTKALRDIVKAENAFVWTEAQDKEFHHLTTTKTSADHCTCATFFRSFTASRAIG